MVASAWGYHFAGALAYADDVVLLASSASALRLMLPTCESFAFSNGLSFNPSKTQLIRFSLFKSHSYVSNFTFCNQALPLVHSVSHPGNKLTHNLLDDDDIILVSSND